MKRIKTAGVALRASRHSDVSARRVLNQQEMEEETPTRIAKMSDLNRPCQLSRNP